MSKPKLKLVGEDGNAFSILGRATKAAKAAGWSKDQIEAYTKDAMCGDYNHLLYVTAEYFDCTEGDEDDDLDNEMCSECGDTLLFCECPDQKNENACENCHVLMSQRDAENSMFENDAILCESCVEEANMCDGCGRHLDDCVCDEETCSDCGELIDDCVC